MRVTLVAETASAPPCPASMTAADNRSSAKPVSIINTIVAPCRPPCLGDALLLLQLIEPVIRRVGHQQLIPHIRGYRAALRATALGRRRRTAAVGVQPLNVGGHRQSRPT